MTRRLPQSTAYVVTLKVFLTSDHVSAATGKTVAITLSKAGAAFANPAAGATNATEIANGWYKVSLGTGDTDTLGDLVVRGTATACDDSEQVAQVVAATNGGMTALPAVAAEAAGGLYTRGTGAGQINQDSNGRIDSNVLAAAGTAWGSGAITAASIASNAITAAKFAAGAIDAAAIATDAIGANEFAQAAADKVWATAARVLTAGTNIVLAKGTGVTGFNDLSAAQVNTEADTAISDAALATAANVATLTAFVDTEVASILAAVDTEVAAILADTNELQVDWVNGGRLDLILDARASQTSVDDLPTNAELTTALAGADDAVLAQVALVKAKTDNLPSDPADESLIIAATDAIVALIGVPNVTLAADIAAVSAPTAAAVADAVWDEALAGHVGAGSAGEALSAAGTAGDPWTTALPGAYGAGTAGQIIGDNIDAAISSRLASGSVTVGTNNDKTGYAIGTGGIVAASFAANAIDSGALAASAVTEIQSGLATAASIAALNNLSAAQVNAEVDTALADYDAAQPGDIPTAVQNADALLDRASAVDTYTVRQILRVLAAALAGEITFAGNTASAKAADGSKTRITSQTNAQEERISLVIDAT